MRNKPGFSQMQVSKKTFSRTTVLSNRSNKKPILNKKDNSTEKEIGLFREQLDKIICRKTFLWKKEDDGIVVIRSKGKHILNKKGSSIWGLIDEKNTIRDILTKYKKHYSQDENSKNLENEALELLARLHCLDLIEFTESLWEEEKVK